MVRFRIFSQAWRTIWFACIQKAFLLNYILYGDIELRLLSFLEFYNFSRFVFILWELTVWLVGLIWLPSYESLQNTCRFFTNFNATILLSELHLGWKLKQSILIELARKFTILPRVIDSWLWHLVVTVHQIKTRNTMTWAISTPLARGWWIALRRAFSRLHVAVTRMHPSWLCSALMVAKSLARRPTGCSDLLLLLVYL